MPGDLPTDLPNRAHALPDQALPPVADHCNVGAVLRSVLFVEAVMAVGALLQADGVAVWLLLFSGATGTALPGVLLWQLAACGSRRWRVRHGLAAQRLWLAGLGGLAGAAASALHAYAMGGAMWGDVGGAISGAPGGALGGAIGEAIVGASPGGPFAGSVLAGAGLALVLHEVLHLRALALAPAQAAARLAELQSRIRPHFLFNALNTALSLVRDDPLRAESVIEDLAELFRGAMADDVGGTRTVRLADEVALAQRYVAIEQLRFGPRLRIAWTLDPSADEARLPPLLLQPLLDNAVRHGVECAPDGGTVEVRTEARRGQAVITVANTVPPDSGPPGHGIALRNVRERLLLLHDVAAQFEAGLGKDGLFRVRLVAPLPE